MHDEDDERDALQGSLFAPESLAPPNRHARPPGPTPDPFAPAPSEATDVPPSPDPLDAPADVALAPGDEIDGAFADDAPAAAGDLATVAGEVVEAPSGLVPAPDEAVVAGFVEVVSPAAAPHSGDVAPRRRAAPLSGPTLDDVMSRVWEGMRAEVPTPCPVCRTEIEPSTGGRCGSCGSALD